MRRFLRHCALPIAGIIIGVLILANILSVHQDSVPWEIHSPNIGPDLRYTDEGPSEEWWKEWWESQ